LDSAEVKAFRGVINKALEKLQKELGWTLSVSMGIDCDVFVTIRMAHGIEKTVSQSFRNPQCDPAAGLERLATLIQGTARHMLDKVADFDIATQLHVRLQSEFPKAFVSKSGRTVAFAPSRHATQCLSLTVDDRAVEAEFNISEVAIEEVCVALRTLLPHLSSHVTKIEP
jgi:hypothetical protein